MYDMVPILEAEEFNNFMKSCVDYLKVAPFILNWTSVIVRLCFESFLLRCGRGSPLKHVRNNPFHEPPQVTMQLDKEPIFQELWEIWTTYDK